jgi:hypothetical protein
MIEIKASEAACHVSSLELCSWVLQGMVAHGSLVKTMWGTQGTLPGEVVALAAVKTSRGGGFFLTNSGGGEWLLRCTSDQGEGCGGFNGF